GSPQDTKLRTSDFVLDTLTIHWPSLPRGIRLVPPPSTNRLIGFVTEQRWQGYVTEVTVEAFHGIVFDTKIADQSFFETAEFAVCDVAELMRPLIKPGAIFFWDIGFEVEASGQRVRRSIVSFPMIPVHTKQQLNDAQQRAKKRFESLGWD